MRVDKTKWEKVTLGKVGQIITGATPSTKDVRNYESKDISFFKPGDLDGNVVNSLSQATDSISYYGFENSRKLPSGAILITCIGIIGKVGVLANPATCNQQINAIICNSNFSNRFIAYNTLYHRDILSQKANGPVVPIINKSSFSKYAINVPQTLEEQQAIVSELDAIQTMIDGYKAQLADFDTLARSIFLDMFGNVAINDKHWNIIPMGQLGDFKNGLNYNKREKGRTLKIIGVGDFQNIKSLTSFDNISSIEIESIPQEYLLHCEDIVFVRSNGNKNLVGRCLEVYPNDIEITFSGFCIRFRKTVEIINKYLIALLTDIGFKKTHILKSKGIGIQNINQKLLGNLPIPVPPIEMQQQFANRVEAIEKQKELIKSQLADAETLMTERMQYYFS